MIEQHDEPDLLRDQFRQLIRYRVLIVAGVVIGLLGGAVLALSGADKYVATSEITVRAATVNPFATGATPDKILNMGSERQTAASGVVAERAAKALGQPEAATELLANLQVTNPRRPRHWTSRTPAAARGKRRPGPTPSPRPTWTTGSSRPCRASRSWSTATRPSWTRW
ncbi:hypothetical protein [Streptomyces sp. RKAG337]|uniref:hypothetical protein n=1 Tax=Streptomyces sp. RKAG337 TaxID=2893404 RepID=UPI0020341033|nr:hypothetical protein [Streptomyces sp. RKAG337]MCM2428750.1 hypothetical protein [Streptomyces sp. RKAG337]